MTPEQQMYDGDQARQVLENEQFVQAFADIETEITQAWQNSPVRDEEGRQELYRLLMASKKFKSMLLARLEAGKLAKHQLENERVQAQMAKDRATLIAGWSSPYS
jgi:hypothetical protein